MSQPKKRAQLVDERQERSYTWRRFREWLQDSLFVYLLDKVPERRRAALEQQKDLLLRAMEHSRSVVET